MKTSLPIKQFIRWIHFSTINKKKKKKDNPNSKNSNENNFFTKNQSFVTLVKICVYFFTINQSFPSLWDTKMDKYRDMVLVAPRINLFQPKSLKTYSWHYFLHYFFNPKRNKRKVGSGGWLVQLVFAFGEVKGIKRIEEKWEDKDIPLCISQLSNVMWAADAVFFCLCK